MNVNSITNTAYSSYIPTREKDKNGESFEDFLAEYSAGADETQAVEISAGGKNSNEPRYSVTDEEAEYFREKYGEEYDEDALADLFYELADNGIISGNDACKASGVIGIMPLSAFKSITYIGSGSGYGLERYAGADLGFISDRVFIKDICRTDENAYKREWDSFKEKYDSDISAWKDLLQESIDFERYLKELAKNSANGKHYPSQWHFDNVIESLEKTKDVISQIFG